MKRTSIFFVLLCLSFVSIAARAPAHTKTYGGSMSLQLTTTFSGKLSSALAACERNRYITIYVQGSSGTATAFATTKANGSFETGTGFYGGNQTYKAVTPAKTVLKNGQHTHKCKAVTKILPGKPPQ